MANKCDLATPEQLEDFRRFAEAEGLPLFTISAATTDGVRDLISHVARTLSELPPLKVYEPDFVRPEIRQPDRSFEVTVEDGIYYVDAPWLENLMSTINPDDYESLQYFQRVLRESGIIDRLDQMGIGEGDTVDIQGFQFEYIH